MKFGFGVVFLWIQVLVLAVMADETARRFGWPPFGVVCAWIGGATLGLIPLVRTVALFGLLAVMLPWWKALPLALVGAWVMLFISGIGKALLKTDTAGPDGPA